MAGPARGGLQVEGHVDAVDLNLGCPQRAATREHFGAALLSEPALVERLVRAAARAPRAQRTAASGDIG